MMKPRRSRVFLTILLLAAAALAGCQKDYERPASIGDVRMEAGFEPTEVVFFARFANPRGQFIVTRGSLEIHLEQDGKEFFHETIAVEPKKFEAYGKSGNMQFKTAPFQIAVFKFAPRFNKAGWYDHKLKAWFWTDDEGQKLMFEGGYSFDDMFGPRALRFSPEDGS
jgi:hypothetical protein